MPASRRQCHIKAWLLVTTGLPATRSMSSMTSTVRIPPQLIVDLPRSISSEFSRAFDVHLVESCTSSFEHWYGLLLRFIEREGNARVSQSHIECGFKLGSWAHNQRMFFKRGALASDLAERLEARIGVEGQVRVAQEPRQPGRRIRHRVSPRSGAWKRAPKPHSSP